MYLLFSTFFFKTYLMRDKVHILITLWNAIQVRQGTHFNYLVECNSSEVRHPDYVAPNFRD